MKLIHGQGNKKKNDLRAARKRRLRAVMLESQDPQKVFHAAVRWYAMRDKWETDSKSEFALYDSMLQLVADEFSPAWLAREFPAVKEYKGHTWGAKDYYSCMEVLEASRAGTWTREDVQSFLWGWDNLLLIGFTVAGFHLVDELRAMQGEPSIMEAFAHDMGVKVYRSVKLDNGKEIMMDEDGRSMGVVRKRHKHLRAVR
jgi:hypothetical protein